MRGHVLFISKEERTADEAWSSLLRFNVNLYIPETFYADLDNPGIKRNTKLGDSSHEKSVRLRQETKNKIDEMLANGTKITFKSVMEECGVSKGFVYDKDIRAYINEAHNLRISLT